MKKKENNTKILKADIGYAILEVENISGKQVIKKAEIVEVSISSKDLDNLQEFCIVEAKRLKDVKIMDIVLESFIRNPIVMIDHNYSLPPIGKVLYIDIQEKKIKMKVQFAPEVINKENL